MEKIVKPCTNEDCAFFARYSIVHGVPFCVDPGKVTARLRDVCSYCSHFARFDLLTVPEVS